MRRVSWFAVMTFCVAIGVLPGGTAWASVTIGQLAPGISPTAYCNSGPADVLQPGVSGGNSYVVPGNGTITSWSHNAAAGSGQTLTMKIFRQVSGTTYSVVGHDGPRNIAASMLNTFQTHIVVQRGDVLGLNDQNAGSAHSACIFPGVGESQLQAGGDLADGESGSFAENPSFRTNVTAVFDPSSTFALGPVTRNKKRGTAQVTATGFPNVGEVTASGKGLKFAAIAGATSIPVSPSGSASFRIKAAGKNGRRLNATGKVKVKVGVAYTPTGGSANVQTLKVTLKKRR
jgi:hypothetical protein